MGRDSDQSKNRIKQILIWISAIVDNPMIKGPLIGISAIADWIAITSFAATIVKQDLLLIFLMAVAVIVILVVMYLIWRLGGIAVILIAIGSLVLAIVAWSLLESSEVTSLQVNITDPQDDEIVTWQPLGHPVKGTVSDPNARVYVIVRTLPAAEWWVQQPAVVGGDGKWQALAYFGDETIRSKEEYQAIALATNDNFLVTWATGNSLSQGRLLNLPRKSNKSSFIAVIRLK